MIKMTTICSIHAIHVFLRNSLVIFSLLFALLFIALNIGIKIDSVTLSKYHIDGLYIKLDKKLTLKANKIIIKKDKQSPSFGRINDILERVKYVLTFFDHIELKEIHFKNNILGIYYYNNIVQLSSKDYLIRGNVHREGKMLKGTIPILQLKKHNMVLRGTFTYDLHDDILITKGKFKVEHTSGTFLATKTENKIKFSLKSNPFSDLKSLVEPLAVSPKIKSWLLDKVQAKEYTLESLSGAGIIKNKKFKLDTQSIKAKALFSDVNIYFKDDISPILASHLFLTYNAKQGLIFDLDRPRYLGKNLDGSSVSIVNLRDENITLHINLKFDTKFDKRVQDLLKAYKVTVPIIQKSGKVKASLDVKLGLKKKFIDFVTDINFTKGNLLIGKIELPLLSGNLQYKNKKITLKNMLLKNKYYSGNINGIIDLKKKKLKAIFDAKYITMKQDKKNLIHLKNKKLPFVLDYSKNIHVKINTLGLDFLYKNKKSILSIDDLNKVKPYLSESIPIEEGGKIKIKTNDFKTYRFEGMVQRNSCFLYQNEDECLTKISLIGKITPNNIDFYAFDKRLYYNKLQSTIKLQNINIDLKKFLNENKKYERKSENEKKSVKKSQKKNQHLIILGENSNLRYDEYRLITDSYDVEVKENGDIQATGSSYGDIIKFSRQKELFTLQALRIKDKSLHPLINFDGLQKGRYSIKKSGNPNMMMGEIIVEGGVMKGFQAYNNTLAFINTIPALATLHKPGYSEEGFIIKSGLVEYRMIKRDKIIFDSIYIEGESATIVGKGSLDLKAKTIDMSLSIQVARELGKVVGSIPLVGYILIGEDKSITVGLNIKGSLDKPIVSISAAKDILSYPVNMIKRVLDTTL